ncbi:MAG: carboxypeptidase-like regulatory domain-containing protein, partial [Prevotellaceae bacterium]|nr:carboxypeptidase-like regulatory domain-containing protein [Prevotellaceae bacterium]
MALAAGCSLLPQMTKAETAIQAVQQVGGVTGQVTDKTGETIIGATVKVVGTQNATVTDLDGNFKVNAKPGQTIEVTYIGYKTQTVKVGKGPLKIVLEDDTQVLNDVVVVGYGTMRKKDLTGSVVQIKPEKLADQNPGSVQDLLRGTPGLQIGFDSSAKGRGASIQLRGQNSLYTDGSHNSPLIILDGMQFNGELSEIN